MLDLASCLMHRQGKHQFSHLLLSEKVKVFLIRTQYYSVYNFTNNQGQST